jgi:ribosome-associated protein
MTIMHESDPTPKSAATHELAPGVYAPEGAIRVQFSRSSGPGGQNVNKLNTKAEVWVSIQGLRGLSIDAIQRLMMSAGHRLTREGQIHIVAESERSQEQNRAEVFEKLRQLLVEAMIRPKPRKRTRPTRGSKQRRLETKKARSAVKAGRRFREE